MFNSSCHDDFLPHSQLILTAADRMQQVFKLNRSYVGVYARTERLAMLDQQQTGFMENCFHKFQTLIKNDDEIDHLPMVLVHDAGTYGSKTFDINLKRRSDKFLNKFKSSKIRTVQYDPKQNNDLPQHRAFVAAVEQQFLSRSHILIGIGFGGFMMNLKGRFLDKHNTERLHVLCENID